jgi:hypothetical protein
VKDGPDASRALIVLHQPASQLGARAKENFVGLNCHAAILSIKNPPEGGF